MTVVHLSSRHSTADAFDLPHGDTWRESAACTSEDPDLFFPDDELPLAERIRVEEQAKAVCRRCPVLDACRAWGVEKGPRDGVWGGTAERDRRNEVRRPVLAAADTARKGGHALAVERGRDVIVARLGGATEDAIAEWADVDVVVARQALRILLPPMHAAAVIPRSRMTPVERALIHLEEPLRVMARAGRTHSEIGRALALSAGTVADALRVLAHRDAAAAEVQVARSGAGSEVAA